MKKILLSTRPKWCEKICHEIGKDKNGKPIYEKPIEVRKTKPSIPTPFKVLIYCCKAKSQWRYSNYEGAYENSKGEIVYAQQHIIGEFVCDWIAEYDCELYNDGSDEEIRTVWYDEDDGERYTEIIAHTGDNPWLLRHACMSWDEFKAYMGEGEKTFYAWHISDLKIYDKSKELSEFRTPPCEKSEKACGKCKYLVKIDTPDMYEVDCFVANGREITRPPQSWCYVQELEERK